MAVKLSEIEWQQRRVLVTGGGGFIGSHLVRRLVSLGSEVVSLGGNRDDTEVVEGARPVFGNISRDTLETVGFVPESLGDSLLHQAGEKIERRKASRSGQDRL